MDSVWGNIFRFERDRIDNTKFLEKIPIFAGLRKGELRALERITHLRKYQRGEIIFHRNDPGVGLYVVRSGSVKIVIEQPAASAPSDEPILLANLLVGDFFGEASLPDGSPRSATAIAEEETELIGLFRPDLLDFCSRDAKTGNKILWNVCEVLAKRLRHVNDALSSRKVSLQKEQMK